MTEVRDWLTLMILSLIWGTSFIMIKKALLAFDPVDVAMMRICISGVAFLPFFFYVFRQLDWKRWKLYALVGLTGSAIPAFLYATAQTKLSSATSGILNSLTPIFTIIIAVLIFRDPTSKKQVLGSVLGFLGTALLIILDKPAVSTGSNNILYALLIISGTILYGLNVNLVKQYFQDVQPLRLNVFSFSLLGIPFMAALPFTDIPQTVMTHPEGMTSLGALCFLGLVSTALALIIFYKLVQDTSAVFASSVAYMMPIVALVWGMMDGEYIGWMHFCSMGIILVGVYMIRSGQPEHFKS